MRLTRLASATIIVLLVTACGAAQPSGRLSVNLDEATAMTEDVLDAFNDGDYAQFSRDWSQTMKDSIPEEAFMQFRHQLMATHGRYVSLDGSAMVPAETAHSTRYEFTTTFEQGPVRVAVVIPESGELIEGLFMEPTDA